MSKYYLLNTSIVKETEKAIQICSGNNNSNTNFKEFFSWIPKSIIKEIDSSIYVPAWFVMSNSDIKDVINFKESKDINDAEKVKKTRKTKAEKEQQQYNDDLNRFFINGVPAEYIEYYFDNDDMRFSYIEKLNTLTNKTDIIKVVIVKNNNREIVKNIE